ncbi:MAG: hypothetical protein ACK559_21065, partial [bacterium]
CLLYFMSMAAYKVSYPYLQRAHSFFSFSFSCIYGLKILSGQILYSVFLLSGPDISISGVVEYTEKYDDRGAFPPPGPRGT